MKKPGLGQAWSDAAIAKLLGDLDIPHQSFDGDETMVAKAVEDLADGKVAGWFQGRFEWGPRSLGHRSILGDPTRKGMTERINKKVKFREQFRPFAPAVLQGREHRYFDLAPGTDLLMPWMLGVFPVKPCAQDLLPSTTHVDGTARVQVVDELSNPLFHRLLGAFGKATGNAVLLNTSFNLKGEPIVSSPLQALRTFYSSELDVLYLGRFRVLNTAIGKHHYE